MNPRVPFAFLESIVCADCGEGYGDCQCVQRCYLCRSDVWAEDVACRTILDREPICVGCYRGFIRDGGVES